ncbi:hypothetical protein ACJJID_07230 [Microbulbifer sp. CnH-101-G]|uniref:hypothetical protein n=1 Tax=Microbulbifer sp. CnH-101-G TaxID=3243393 RepID=UPI004039D162
MTKIISRSINQGVGFSVLVEDTAPVLFQTKVKKSLESWLDEAQTILSRAEAMCTTALVSPKKVSGKFNNLLSYYFGLPANCPNDRYRSCLNAILKRLTKTQRGLSSGVECADVSMMPTLAKIQTSAMSAVGLGNPTKKMAGFVWVDIFESVPRYLSNNYKLTTVGGGYLNGGSFKTDYKHPICLNFEEIWKRGENFCIVTLIHEGTHKYAQTVDLDPGYFKDGGIVDKLDQAISNGGMYMKIYMEGQGLTHDQAFERVVEQALNQLRGQDSAASHMAKLAEVKAVDNADSLAWFAHDVAQLPSEVEVGKVVGGILGNRKIHPSLLNH